MKKVILFTFLDPKMFWENPVFKSCADSVLEKIRKKFEMDENGEIVFKFFDLTNLIKARCLSGLDLEEEIFGKNNDEQVNDLPKEMCTFAVTAQSITLFAISENWTKSRKNKDIVLVVEDENKYSFDPYLVSLGSTFPNYIGILAKNSPGSIFMLSEVLKV